MSKKGKVGKKVGGREMTIERMRRKNTICVSFISFSVKSTHHDGQLMKCQGSQATGGINNQYLVVLPPNQMPPLNDFNVLFSF